MEILLDKNLLARWCDLWRRLGARSTPEPIFAELVRRYAELHRAYHTLDHIQDCLQQLDQVRVLLERTDEVELAIWCHDVIYDSHAADNEARSATWAGKILEEGGVATEVISRIQDLILATRHDTPPERPDAILLADIDLTSLGYTAASFDCNNAAIRREYQWVPAAAYRAARVKVLESFLARPTIYQTAWFHDRYEAQARANLTRTIRDLRNAAL
jgi:predicted metal-dependent HD superfamily phosphohydrolase